MFAVVRGKGDGGKSARETRADGETEGETGEGVGYRGQRRTAGNHPSLPGADIFLRFAFEVTMTEKTISFSATPTPVNSMGSV